MIDFSEWQNAGFKFFYSIPNYFMRISFSCMEVDFCFGDWVQDMLLLCFSSAYFVRKNLQTYMVMVDVVLQAVSVLFRKSQRKRFSFFFVQQVVSYLRNRNYQ